MQYYATLDSSAVWFTIELLVALLLICFLNIWRLKRTRNTFARIFYGFATLVIVAVIVGSYLYHPQKYVLGNFDFYIKRPVKDIVIRVKDINEIRNLDDAELDGATRTMGVDGFFGYFGSYNSPKLGDFTMYATRTKKLVVIYTRKGDAYIISPDDPGFVERMKAKMEDLR